MADQEQTARHLLQALVPELNRCNKCGFCMDGCPTFRSTGLEWHVTRGRVSLIQDAADGEIAVAELAAAVESCLLCRGCVSHCPPQVPIDLLITRARAAMRAERPLPWPVRLLLRQVLARPWLLRLLGRLGFVAERLGLRAMLGGALAARRWPLLARAHHSGPRLTGRSARSLLAGVDRRPAGPARARVAYYVTCTREVLTPHAARAAVRVLTYHGVEVVLPQVGCCGLPAHSLGDLEGARALGRRVLAALGDLAVDAIIVDEGSCCAHLTELPRLFAGQPEEAAARALAARVRDLATFLVELGPRPMGPLFGRITWHDPCHLRHYLHVADAPRRLLAAIAGAEYVEARDADVCCGGAGAIMLTQPALSDDILARKMQAFAETEAAYLVTASPSCLMQLQRGQRGQALPIVVLSLAEMLERAIPQHREENTDAQAL